MFVQGKSKCSRKDGKVQIEYYNFKYCAHPLEVALSHADRDRVVRHWPTDSVARMANCRVRRGRHHNNIKIIYSNKL